MPSQEDLRAQRAPGLPSTPLFSPGSAPLGSLPPSPHLYFTHRWHLLLSPPPLQKATPPSLCPLHTQPTNQPANELPAGSAPRAPTWVPGSLPLPSEGSPAVPYSCLRPPHLEGVLAPDVHAVSDPGGPQLPAPPAQQDRGLQGPRPLRLQEQLQAGGLGPVQVVVEGELGRDRGWSGETRGPGSHDGPPCIPHLPHRAVVWA